MCIALPRLRRALLRTLRSATSHHENVFYLSEKFRGREIEDRTQLKQHTETWAAPAKFQEAHVIALCPGLQGQSLLRQLSLFSELT